jgi:hypothetical protein
MPAAWHGWAETLAASRVLHHPDLSAPAIVSGQTHATRERLRTPAVGWLGQETTLLQDGTPPPQAGLGPVTSNTRAENRLHPTVAFPPARVTCGVLGRQVWPRPEPPVAPQRQRNPMAEQERYRGRAG